LAALQAIVYGEIKAKTGRACRNNANTPRSEYRFCTRRYNRPMHAALEIDREDPLTLFDLWMKDAEEREPSDPNAAALATCTSGAQPSVRMVLVKRVGEVRFAFFTNGESRKGIELAENPRAALCFHWKSLRRQVRVEGRVTELPAEDVDTYFRSRSRASQIGAAVSLQSQPLASREGLERKVQIYAEEHPGEIPRPDYWRGFQLEPVQIEFWIDGAHRLHNRFLFARKGSSWRKMRLYP
jgi:pyridoxamine 5'-phosphate oxidase